MDMEFSNVFRRGISGALAAAVVAGGLAAAATTTLTSGEAQAQDEQFIPLLVYRTGPYAPNGIPVANGAVDYYNLINERDGGINGVTLTFEECEYRYDTKLGVECYERLKNKGPTGASLIMPLSTGVTYQLNPRAPVDQIPVHSMGYGQTAASDGRVFPWTFTFPTTYWSQASAFIKYVGAQEGGMDQLAGKTITLIYHNSPYGKEPIPTLQVLAEKHGYTLELLPVDHPGQEQRATWLQIRKIKPDWTFLWGWGVMNQVAIKEAAAIAYPMERPDRRLVVVERIRRGAGRRRRHRLPRRLVPRAGAGFPVHDDILQSIYGGDAAAAAEKNFGEVLYNRGLLASVYTTEAIRTAMGKYGNRSLTGAEVRWGLENLDLTEERLAELGLAGFTPPVKITCEDHEGNGPVIIQQWDGSAWNIVSDWIEPMQDVVRPMIEADAAKYAAENNITPRDCSQEM